MLINDLIKQGGRIIGVEREFRGTLSARGTLSVGTAVAREGKKGTRRGQALFRYHKAQEGGTRRGQALFRYW